MSTYNEFQIPYLKSDLIFITWKKCPSGDETSEHLEMLDI